MLLPVLISLLALLHDPVDPLAHANDHCGLAGRFHRLRGDWLLLHDGRLAFGRDRLAGGALTLLAPASPDGRLTGPNLVNSWDTGRQVQLALREAAPENTEHWNPTQGGDGTHPARLPGGRPDDVVLVGHACGADDPGYAVSDSRALDFVNLSAGFPPAAPLPIDAVRFRMTTEFLPGVPGALLLHSVASWRPDDPDHAGYPPSGQSVLPAIHLVEGAVDGGVLVPMAQPAWARDGDGFAAAPLRVRDHSRADGDVADRASQVATTEGWVFVPGRDGSPGLGVASSSQVVAVRRFSLAPADDRAARGAGDHQAAALLLLPREVFPVSLPPGERRLVRDGLTLLVLGDDVDAVRRALEPWRPTAAGPFAKWPRSGTAADGTALAGEAPADGLADLDLNGRGLSLGRDEAGAWLSMTRDVDSELPVDLTIARRVWGDVIVDLELAFDAPTDDGWAGLALRKSGSSHAFAAAGDALLVLVRPDGLRLSVDRRHRPYDLASPLPFVRPRGLPEPARERPPVTALRPGENDGDPTRWHRLRVLLTGDRVRAWLDAATPQPEATDEAPLADIDVPAVLGGGPLPPLGALALVALPRDGPVRFRALAITPLGDADASAPAAPTDAQARLRPDGVHLSWTLPADDDWRTVRVLRRDDGSAPRHWRDGLPVYEGRRRCALDPTPPPGARVRYAVFTLDRAANPSVPAVMPALAVPGSFVPHVGGASGHGAAANDATSALDPGEALRSRSTDLEAGPFTAWLAAPLDADSWALADARQPQRRPMRALDDDGSAGSGGAGPQPVVLASGVMTTALETDAVLAYTARTCGTLRVDGRLGLARPHPLGSVRVSLWLEPAGEPGDVAPAWLAHRSDLDERRPLAEVAPLELTVCPGDRLLVRFGAAPGALEPAAVQHDLSFTLLPYFAQEHDACRP